MKLTAKFLIAFVAIAVLSIGLLGLLTYNSARGARLARACHSLCSFQLSKNKQEAKVATVPNMI